MKRKLREEVSLLRLWDAILARYRDGEDVEDIALDYDTTVGAVRLVITEAALKADAEQRADAVERG
jgi:hypothetical protein